VTRDSGLVSEPVTSYQSRITSRSPRQTASMPGGHRIRMSNQELNNPHDMFFKEMFGRKERALGFLREYLPAPVYAQLDISTLELVKDSYVDKELTQHFSDILYKVSIAGRPSFLYLLFEHKSYVDRLVGFQLLRNMVKIWERHLKENERSRFFPVIVPIVIYHGRTKWTGQGDFRRL
jgi:predicted transposase/invertase (TIGR01784 family)